MQNIHQKNTLRIAGIAIISALYVGVLITRQDQNLSLLLALSPVFLIGITEDITQKIPSIYRLLSAFLSAFIALSILGVELNHINWPWFDQTILSIGPIAILFSVFMIAGISHAANVIDGANGLLLGHSILAAAIFLTVAYQVNDLLIINANLIFIFSLLGVFVFNFPHGRIFVGDGGAYIIGAFLAIIALSLVAKHHEVSPWFPLAVMIYPVFEALFSLYRRSVSRHYRLDQADRRHLHSLLYRRLLNNHFKYLSVKFGRNAATSILIWLFTAPFMLVTLLAWQQHLLMITTALVFCVCYLFVYFAIVRFKNRWGKF